MTNQFPGPIESVISKFACIIFETLILKYVCLKSIAICLILKYWSMQKVIMHVHFLGVKKHTLYMECIQAILQCLCLIEETFKFLTNQIAVTMVIMTYLWN